MSQTPTKALFSLGRLLSTPGALDAFQAEGITGRKLLERHLAGDWGQLSGEDRRENDFAVSRRLRIFSAYLLPKTGVKVWLITEADRSATTFLLPDEY